MNKTDGDNSTGLVDAYGRAFDGKAPAFNGRAEFDGYKDHELCRIDVENVPKDERTHMILETYPAPEGVDPLHEPAAMARRYWAIERKIMVGGWIKDASDWLHLASWYGITHSLSFDDAHDDEGKVAARADLSMGGRASCPFTLGAPKEPLMLKRVVKWLKELPAEAVVYAHGRLGNMRGPCAAYMVGRVRHGLSREDGQKIAGRGPACSDHPWGQPLQANFLWYIDQAILAVVGR